MASIQGKDLYIAIITSAAHSSCLCLYGIMRACQASFKASSGPIRSQYLHSPPPFDSDARHWPRTASLGNTCNKNPGKVTSSPDIYREVPGEGEGKD